MALANMVRCMNSKANKNVPLLWLALGAGIGAALTYWFHPRRNRPLPQRQPQDAPPNRLPAPIPDHILEERVREEFSRKIQHARAIQIEVHDGVVKVSGPILIDEVDKLIYCIRAVPGVKRVEDHLQAHKIDNSPARGPGKPYLQ